MGSGVPAARLRHEDVRLRQRRRSRHPRHQRSRDRQRQAVSAKPHLRAEGPAVRKHRRQVQGRLRAGRTGAAGSRASVAVSPSPTSTTTAISTSSISSLGQRPVAAEEPGRAAGQLDHDSSEGKEEQRVRPGRHGEDCRRRKGVQVREINNVASYLSSNDVRLHFGLGQREDHSADRDPLAERHAPGAEGRRRQSDSRGRRTVIADGGDSYERPDSLRADRSGRWPCKPVRQGLQA